MLKKSNSKSIQKIKVKDILLHGVHAYNYFFKETSGLEVELYFKNPVSQERVFLKKTPTKANSLVFKTEFIKGLNQINEKCAGFHVLEHILLRTQQKTKWQLIILNEVDQKPIFYSATYSSPEELQLISINFLAMAANEDYYQILKNTETDRYYFYLKDDDGIYFLKSAKSYSRAEIQTATKKVFLFFKKLKEENPSAINELMFLDKVSLGQDLITNDIYSNQISLFFPNWVARFQTIQHRQLIESIILQNTPANLKIHFHWLSIAKMSKFESLFFAWSNHSQDEQATAESRDQMAFELIKFLGLNN